MIVRAAFCTQVVFISKCAQQVPLTFEDYVYPRWANGLGWAIVAFPCIIMVAVFIYVYCSRGGYTVSRDRHRDDECQRCITYFTHSYEPICVLNLFA